MVRRVVRGRTRSDDRLGQPQHAPRPAPLEARRRAGEKDSQQRCRTVSPFTTLVIRWVDGDRQPVPDHGSLRMT